MNNIRKIIKANKEEAIRILQDNDGRLNFDIALNVDNPWVVIDIGDGELFDAEVEAAELNEKGDIELEFCNIGYTITVSEAIGYTENNVYEAIEEIYNAYLKPGEKFNNV